MRREESKDRARTGARGETQAAAMITPPTRNARLLGYVLLALAAALLSLWLANVSAGAALAQQSGQFSQDSTAGQGGDAFQQTLFNIADYIALTILPLGVIGFLGSLALKAASPVNENAQYLANMGIKGSAIAVIGSGIALPLMGILQGLAATGGG